MSTIPYLKRPEFENNNLATQSVAVKVTLSGDTTTANIKGWSDNSRVFVYTSGANTTGTDSDTGMSGLTNASGSVVGILVQAGDVSELIAVDVPVAGIQSASMSAGSVALKGSTSGVTTSNNAAFQITMTGTTLSGSVANSSFYVFLRYRVKPAS